MSLNFMAAVTICSDFWAQKIVCHGFHCIPIYLPWSDGIGCHDLSFLNIESQLFHSPLSLSSRGSSFSVIKVEQSVYLRLLIFLLAILIPACASSSPVFCMIYSANKLNKQGDDIQSRCTPSPTLNHSAVPCLVLTLVSWPAYRRSMVVCQEAGKVVWYSHLFKNFPVCCDPPSQRL